MLRPLPSYKKRSILPSTVSFPASSTYQDKYNALCTPCSSTSDRKSICNEQTIRFEPTPPPITRQKCCKSSITNLNFTVGVSVTCASCLGFFPIFFFFSLFSPFLFISLTVACLAKSAFYQKSVGNYVLPLIVLGNSSFRKFSTSIEDRRSFSPASISLCDENRRENTCSRKIARSVSG